MEYPVCELGKNRGDIRDSPRNQEAAYAIQFHDTAQVLYAHAGTPDAFKRNLKVLESQINSYWLKREDATIKYGATHDGCGGTFRVKQYSMYTLVCSKCRKEIAPAKRKAASL